jgi:hypothetical protein
MKASRRVAWHDQSDAAHVLKHEGSYIDAEMIKQKKRKWDGWKKRGSSEESLREQNRVTARRNQRERRRTTTKNELLDVHGWILISKLASLHCYYSYTLQLFWEYHYSACCRRIISLMLTLCSSNGTRRELEFFSVLIRRF